METLRKPPVHALDTVALEMLLQAVQVAGLIEGTPFLSEAVRVRRRRSRGGARFDALYGLLTRIHAAGLLNKTPLEQQWLRVRSARASGREAL